MQEEQGAKTLAELGLGNLKKVEGIYLGIEIATLVTQVQNCLNSKEEKYPQIPLIK
jgi:hypothetical protein